MSHPDSHPENANAPASPSRPGLEAPPLAAKGGGQGHGQGGVGKATVGQEDVGQEGVGRNRLGLTLAPIGFLCLWSMGFSFGKLGLGGAEPLTFLAWRYWLALAAMILLAVILRPRLPRGQALLSAALVGLLIQVGYFGFGYLSFRYGLSAGLSALILSLQPILVGLLGPIMTGQPVSGRQWLGLGLGLVGAVWVILAQSGAQTIVASPDGQGGDRVLALVFGLLSLPCITAASLVEARIGRPTHPVSNNMIQYAVGLAVVLPLSLVLEQGLIDFTTPTLIGLGYVVIGNSLIAVSLLMFMLRAGEVARVSALFYLIPPLAAVAAWVILGEALNPWAWPGMAVALGGVVIARRASLRRATAQ